jgi:UDP-N-acetylglucosamine:LPS N-acetylglucosamine transferase
MVDALEEMAPELAITFASYATGAEALREMGRVFVDLKLPEDNPFFETLLISSEVIKSIDPDIVIAHEEFSAVPASKVNGKPVIFVSAWLPGGSNPLAEAIACADSLVVLEEPGIFVPPTGTKERVKYVGPFWRRMNYAAGDRSRARREMSLSDEQIVVTVVPGAFATEKKAPIAVLVRDAFARLAAPKQLFWCAGPDAAEISAIFGYSRDIAVLGKVPKVDQLIVASDVVITKCTRGATMDAVSLGVPTISLSYGLNPMDDLLVSRVPSNVPLNARAVDGAIVAMYIERVLNAPDSYRPRRRNKIDDGLPVARGILEEVRRLLQSGVVSSVA